MCSSGDGQGSVPYIRAKGWQKTAAPNQTFIFELIHISVIFTIMRRGSPDLRNLKDSEYHVPFKGQTLLLKALSLSGL